MFVFHWTFCKISNEKVIPPRSLEHNIPTNDGFKLHNRGKKKSFDLPQFSNITANLPELIIGTKYPLQANLAAVISADKDYSLLLK